MQPDQLSGLDQCDFRSGFRIGTLQENVCFWSKALRADEFVLLIIRDGYRIPSVSLLEPYFFRNRSSSFNHSEFVQEAIDERLIRDSITQLDLASAFCNPLHVAVQGDGKHRLILDLFFLNKFIWKQSLKYEGVRTVLTMFDWDFYFFTFDLKSG